jgi:hypothetical protein
MKDSESVWDRPGDKLADCLDRIAESLGTFSEGFSHTTTEAEFEHSEGPFGSETIFFEEIAVSVQFNRRNGKLAYSCKISQGRQALARGPAGLIDVDTGLTQAVRSRIEAAFDEIILFLEQHISLIQQGNPAYH